MIRRQSESSLVDPFFSKQNVLSLRTKTTNVKFCKIYTLMLKNDNTIRKSTSKLVRMVQKVKNDKNRDDSLLFSRAQFYYSSFTYLLGGKSLYLNVRFAALGVWRYGVNFLSSVCVLSGVPTLQAFHTLLRGCNNQCKNRTKQVSGSHVRNATL